MTDYLKEYYEENCDEDKRFKSKASSVEFLTTMKYIKDYLKDGMKILEIGAGTGNYSIDLSRMGYEVTSVELVEHNIDVFKSKLNENDKITIFQGNALNLNMLENEYFDIVLLLGPMYHLYTKEDRDKALYEAKRVMKKDGVLMVAYCLNEATMMQWGLKNNGQNMLDMMNLGKINKEYKCLSEAEDIFVMMRLEEIDLINKENDLKREKIISTDLFSRYCDDSINDLNEEGYKTYLDYHFTICERHDLMGCSNHVLDILRK